MKIQTMLKVISVLLLGLLVACGGPKKETTTVSSNTANQQAPINDDSINFAEIATVYFDFDVAKPTKSEEIEKVQQQADCIKKQGDNIKSIKIAGYTDIYGTEEYNIALGERRANSIKDMFVRAGVKGSKIEITSYGKNSQFLEVPATDTANQWKNRRTITKVELAKGDNNADNSNVVAPTTQDASNNSNN